MQQPPKEIEEHKYLISLTELLEKKALYHCFVSFVKEKEHGIFFQQSKYLEGGN